MGGGYVELVAQPDCSRVPPVVHDTVDWHEPDAQPPR